MRAARSHGKRDNLGDLRLHPIQPATQEVNCHDASLRAGSSPASELFGGDLPTAGSGMAMALGPLASAEAEAVW
jgi:hypothetical protein